jgi:hypothetical protein
VQAETRTRQVDRGGNQTIITMFMHQQHDGWKKKYIQWY